METIKKYCQLAVRETDENSSLIINYYDLIIIKDLTF